MLSNTSIIILIIVAVLLVHVYMNHYDYIKSIFSKTNIPSTETYAGVSEIAQVSQISQVEQKNRNLGAKIRKEHPWITDMKSAVGPLGKQNLLVPNRSNLGLVNINRNPEMTTIIAGGKISGERRDAAIARIRPQNDARGMTVPLPSNSRWVEYQMELEKQRGMIK